MKKFLQLCLILFAASGLAAAQSVPTTPNIGLYTPQHATPGWDTYMNTNFSALDSLLSGSSALSSLKMSRYIDFQATTAPLAPSGGFCRAYFDIGTGQFSGINSLGASCAPTGGGSGSVLAPGAGTPLAWYPDGTATSVTGNLNTSLSPSGDLTVHSLTTNGAGGVGTLITPLFQLLPVAFGTLPTCAAPYYGYEASVNDSTVTSLGAVITGGSTNHALGYCDGTNWIVTTATTPNHYISGYQGAPDLGLMIRNCDTALGANPGSCIGDISGTIMTPAAIGTAGNRHSLHVLANVTITESPSLTQPLSIAVGCDGCAVTGEGPTSIISGSNTFYNGATFTGDLLTIGTHTVNWNATAVTTITADVAINAFTVTVASTAGMVAGQDGMLKENLDGSSHVGKWAEFNVIASVTDATHVVLKLGTAHVYRAAFSPSFAVFAAGTLTKNWEVSNLRLTGGVCAPAATGSNSGVANYTSLGGSVHDVWVDCVGGRGILTGASGYPSAHVTISNNHIHDVGYVPLIGSMGIESYSQSSHNKIQGNDVWRTGSHGIVAHGLDSVVDANNVSYSGFGPGSVGSCFSSDTADSITFSNNIAKQCGFDGYLFFGSSFVDTTEATHMTYTGNKCSDVGNDCFDFGTAGSSGFVIVNATNNTALRPRGPYAFFLGGNAGGYRGNVITNSIIENAATGIFLGQTGMSPKINFNDCKNCTTAFDLQSPADMEFIGNSDQGTTTTSVAMGTADFSTFLGYSSNTNVITGTCGVNSTVLGVRWDANSSCQAHLPTGLAGLNLGGGMNGISSLTPSGGSKMWTSSAPNVSSGFGTSPSVIAGSNGVGEFQINVGTGGTANNGVISLPYAATNQWHCTCEDETTHSATVFMCQQTAHPSTTTATIGNFNTSGVAAPWVASDVLNVRCQAH